MEDLIPSHWYSILHRIRYAGFREAFLAGGALRDRIVGVPHKDLDIFIGSHTGQFTRKIRTICRKLQPSIMVEGPRLFGSDREYKESDYDITGLATLKVEGEEVQIVGRNSLATPFYEPTPDWVSEVLNRFDFGICQIALVGETLVTTPAFHQDLRDKTFTQTRPEVRHLSRERFKRFQGRYTGWTYREANDHVF